MTSLRTRGSIGLKKPGIQPRFGFRLLISPLCKTSRCSRGPQLGSPVGKKRENHVYLHQLAC